MKTQVVEALYYDPKKNREIQEIIFFTNEDSWWCEIVKSESGEIIIKRRERDPFGKIIKLPDVPVITEYASEEGRFQLSLIWEDEIDMNFMMECQLHLIPLFETTAYNDDIRFTVQYEESK